MVFLSISFEEGVSACCVLGSANVEQGYDEIPRYGRLEVWIESPTGRMILRPLA
ncbi:hypothetical protein [Verrucomicrobium sp. 3C]|uniref:hypothetical protein n=1 Tax=Verrucomicrobium sp. 3C TaxID=1134055 RepID=UPI0003772AE3|nr:hypothetical protein [Verrucomicrobium sp. 3C]